MGFIITKDIIDNGVYDNQEFLRVEESKEKCIYPFQLLDDDGELYFEGLSSNSSSFAPLDNFGAGYGCTEIKYLENGVWESL